MNEALDTFHYLHAWRRSLEKLLLMGSTRGVALASHGRTFTNYLPCDQALTRELMRNVESAFATRHRMRSDPSHCLQVGFSFDRMHLLATECGSLQLVLLFEKQDDFSFFPRVCHELLKDMVAHLPPDDVFQGMIESFLLPDSFLPGIHLRKVPPCQTLLLSPSDYGTRGARLNFSPSLEPGKIISPFPSRKPTPQLRSAKSQLPPPRPPTFPKKSES